MTSRPSIESRLHALKRLDVDELARSYQSAFGEAPPSNLPKTILERAVRCHLQQQLIAKLRSRLMQIVGTAEAILQAATDIGAEALLVRDWRGRCHVVAITDEGVTHQGETYPTLDAVARIITKGQRTGAEFFGDRLGKDAQL